ncbi:ORFL218C [Human betaherpesvirus 5]|nr:ORFL218C [Human betaherpesvirus 5]QHX40575.1 ORFL218C [Human betaherpesvirus 5]
MSLTHSTVRCSNTDATSSKRRGPDSSAWKRKEKC